MAALFLFLLFVFAVRSTPVLASEVSCPDGSNPSSAVIFCDDFETSQPLSERYFEYANDEGEFIRVPNQGLNSSFGMRVHWQQGEVDAGNLKRLFGRVPPAVGRSQSHSDRDFREIYWRLYLRNESGWSGYPDKLSRAVSFGSESSWAEAMLAHVWSSTKEPVLLIDPATGVQGSQLVTTQYNDFANLKWLGSKAGRAQIFSSDNADKWFCVEAHAKLNSPGNQDGVFELWVNGELDATMSGLNWVGSWTGYGINAVFIENYWNSGAPGERLRYIDNIVVSTQRIGCIGSDDRPPQPPKNLRIRR